MKNIKNLDENQFVTNLINKSTELIDKNTGEIIVTEKGEVQRFKKPDDFVKLFVENIDFFAEGLKPIERKVLFPLIKAMGYDNELILSADLKAIIMGKLEISRASLDRGINGLIKKEVLFHIKNEEYKQEKGLFTNRAYIVNPNLVGKGHLNDLRKVRSVVIKELDSEKGYSKKVERSFFYDGYKELEKNPSDFEIKEINHSVNGKNSSTDIIIENKEPSSDAQNVLELKPNLVENKELEAKKAEILQMLKATPAQPLDEEGQKIMAMAGKWSGFFDPTKSVKEMKMQAIKEDIERIDRQNEQ